MKKKHISKGKCQVFHFKKRCDERIGEQVDRKALQRRIREKNYGDDFYFLDRQSNRVSRYRYKYHDVWYIIPYDKNTHKVVTIFKDNKQDIKPELKEVNRSKIARIFDKLINFILKFLNKHI